MSRTTKMILPVAVLILALVALFPALVAAAPPQDPASAPPQDAANGQKVWAAKPCKSCHGDNGEGKYAAPLAGTARTTQEAIQQVRSPRSMMPMFNPQQVSDQEITDIIDYMKTLQRPASFQPIRYEAQPNDPQGKVLFNQKRCVACHGDYTRTAAGIVASGRKTLTDADVEKQLRTPRQFMPRFSEQEVSQAEAQAIAAYLRPIVEQVAASGGAPAAAAPAAAPAPAQLPTTGADPSLLTALFAALGMASVAAGLALRRRR
ncbi:MAG: c-type cytochrome [Anaerolineae bacterium]|nr:c-type cytochrome [Anaerolineae bacterium]